MWCRETLTDLIRLPVIGMLHLPPLPGAPSWTGDWEQTERRTLQAAAALVGGGLGAVMLENFRDVPFYRDEVPPVTVAAMTRLAGAVRDAHPELKLGVNVLRNDARAALAVALAAGAQFIRVNVHIGACVTDQGVIEGQAHRTLRLRREWGAEIGILADLQVKHARPLVQRPLAEEVADLRCRGLADAVIITGPATGARTDPEQLHTVRERLPDCPLLVGSGVTPENCRDYLPDADGFIVGTYFASGADEAVSADRVAELVTALGGARAPERGETR